MSHYLAYDIVCCWCRVSRRGANVTCADKEEEDKDQEQEQEVEEEASRDTPAGEATMVSLIDGRASSVRHFSSTVVSLAL